MYELKQGDKVQVIEPIRSFSDAQPKLNVTMLYGTIRHIDGDLVTIMFSDGATKVVHKSYLRGR